MQRWRKKKKKKEIIQWERNDYGQIRKEGGATCSALWKRDTGKIRHHGPVLNSDSTDNKAVNT